MTERSVNDPLLILPKPKPMVKRGKLKSIDNLPGDRMMMVCECGKTYSIKRATFDYRNYYTCFDCRIKKSKKFWEWRQKMLESM